MPLNFRAVRPAVFCPGLASDETVALTPSVSSPADRFLQEVEAQLKDFPEAVRADVVRELGQHLDSMIDAHCELGEDRTEAMAAALREIGAPKVIAQRFQRAWESTGPETVRDAVRTSAVLFGTVGLAYALLCTATLSMAHGSAFAESALFRSGIVTIPALLGARMGLKYPRHGGLGALYALALLVLPALVFCDLATNHGMIAYGSFSSLLRHNLTGIWGVWQFTSILLSMCVLWPVVGSVSAILAGVTATRRRLRSKAGA